MLQLRLTDQAMTSPTATITGIATVFEIATVTSTVVLAAIVTGMESGRRN